MLAFQVVAEVLVFAFFLALIVERVTEFVMKPVVQNLMKLFGLDEELTAEKLTAIIPILTAVFGALLSFGFGIDLLMPLAESAGLAPEPWLTRLLTAVIAGGGSNLLHDLWPGQYPPLEAIELEIDDSGLIRE